MAPEAQSVGHAIRQARIGAGLTQAALCELAGLSQPHLASLESGARTPRLETLQRVAEATGGRLDVRIVGVRR